MLLLRMRIGKLLLYFSAPLLFLPSVGYGQKFCFEVLQSQEAKTSTSTAIISTSSGSDDRQNRELAPLDQNSGSALVRDSFQMTEDVMDLFLLSKDRYEISNLDPIGSSTPRIRVYLQVSSKQASHPQTKIESIQRTQGPRLDYKTEGRTMVDSSTGKSLQIANEKSREELSDFQIAVLFAKEQNPDVTDANEIKDLAAYYVTVPRIISETRNRLQTSNAGKFNFKPKLEIANFGEFSYLWFQPSSSGQPLPVRILDLHPHPQGLLIVVEYIEPGKSGDQGKRRIAQLTPREIDTMFAGEREGYNYSRQAAHEIFGDLRTTEETDIVSLASEFGLPLYGYHNYFTQRDASYAGHRNLHYAMNDEGHTAIRVILKDYFPADKYEALHRQLEKDRDFNVNDFFSGMHPRNLFRNWFSGSKWFEGKYEFTWVITEDGQLRIAPHLPQPNGYKPQLLRVAQGRRIFVGGTFVMTKDRKIDVVLNSNGYEAMHDSFGIGGSPSFSKTDGPLDDFIAAAFYSSANIEIGSFNNRPIQSFSSSSTQTFANAFGATSYESSRAKEFKSRGSQRRDRNHFAGAKSKWEQMKAAATTAKTTKKITWTEFPLSYDNWRAELKMKPDTGLRDIEGQVDHSLYVLRAERSDSVRELKRKRAKFAKKYSSSFGTEKTPDSEVISVINGALTRLVEYNRKKHGEE